MLACFTTVQVSAQKDKVLLQNGSVIYGEVTNIDQEKVQVRVDEGLTIMFPVQNVARLKVKDKEREGINTQVLKDLGKANSRGVWKEVSVGMLYGRENNDQSYEATPSVAANATYWLEQFLQIGLGMGYDQYDDFRALPLYLYYKGELTNQWSGPFYYGAVGHGFMWERGNSTDEYSDVTGGLHLRAGMGYRWRLDAVQLQLSMGWKHQKVDAEYSNSTFWWIGNENKLTLARKMNRVELMLGIIF